MTKIALLVIATAVIAMGNAAARAAGYIQSSELADAHRNSTNDLFSYCSFVTAAAIAPAPEQIGATDNNKFVFVGQVESFYRRLKTSPLALAVSGAVADRFTVIGEDREVSRRGSLYNLQTDLSGGVYQIADNTTSLGSGS